MGMFDYRTIEYCLKDHCSIEAYDPGKTTGCAFVNQFDDLSLFELSEEQIKTGDCDGFSQIKICETSSGKDGILSAYLRGYLEGMNEHYHFINQTPAERNKFLPVSKKIANGMKVYSDHMIDALAHLLCFLFRNDKNRYEVLTKGVK